MGSFDGAETRELVGGFLLSQLQTKFGDKIGLYRDDGLAVKDTSPKMTENIKKEMKLVNENPKVRFAIWHFLWIMKCNLREQTPNQVLF